MIDGVLPPTIRVTRNGNGVSRIVAEESVSHYSKLLTKDAHARAFFERTFNMTLLGVYTDQKLKYTRNNADIGCSEIVLVFPNGSKVVMTNSEWGNIEYIAPQQKKGNTQ